MNRPIKFRAIQDGKMSLISGYGSADNGMFELDTKLDSPLMQFTGLLDKNGKEIYEGDVVRGVVKGYEGEYVGAVEYRAPEFGMRIWAGVCDFWERESEVIGNVYEHPELLTSQEV